MLNSVNAFAALSLVSTVEAIGMGDGISENYLEFFDNTDVTALDGEVIIGGNSITGPVGEVTIVNTADELDAALVEGSSSNELAQLGDDTLIGGDGDDIIFGDTINTDHLEWTNVDTGDVFTEGTHDGLGYEGLIEYLKWGVNSGTDPDATQTMNYIKDYYADLIDETRLDGGDDELDGGAGDDILIGGAGADTFKAGEGDDHIVDYNLTDGDLVDISDVFEPGNTLAASDNVGHVKLTILDGSDPQGSITFDNIDYDTGATPEENLDSLLNDVDIDGIV